jgi:hypothetical protein
VAPRASTLPTHRATTATMHRRHFLRDGTCAGSPIDPRSPRDDGDACTIEGCDHRLGCTFVPRPATSPDSATCGVETRAHPRAAAERDARRCLTKLGRRFTRVRRAIPPRRGGVRATVQGRLRTRCGRSRCERRSARSASGRFHRPSARVRGGGRAPSWRVAALGDIARASSDVARSIPHRRRFISRIVSMRRSASTTRRWSPTGNADMLHRPASSPPDQPPGK